MQTLERILYAEDEPDIRQVASLALEVVGGFTLKTCNTGLEAVAEVEAFAPQLLLFDVMMPDMDGPSALAKIREMDAYRKTPAIFMTAKVQPNEIQRYLDMGAVDVIAKPFDPMTLATQIGDIWARTQH
ncbi:response regulator [Neptunomonas antarctica]|uniref:Response regulator receiver domain-containing protein n=1 Tax=Neptunomonas antarctica TaxID=619304 RepID=A0A1N7LMP1_9GAMM|nr:response regulator [Neptunomonas antarctica]SIS75052.1 Response regulator receiver domain-containing protein [Neptunomonas antarctica]